MKNKNNPQRKNQNKPVKSGTASARRKKYKAYQDNVSDYGSQLGSVVSKGYGATLGAYPSTRDFARVYTDPFSRQSARIPDFPVMPTTLIRLEQEFVMTSNGAFGWALFQPLNMLCNGTTFAWRTTGTGAPPGMTTTTGTGVTPQATSSPFTQSSFVPRPIGSGRSARCVSFGLELVNTTTNLNKAGKLYFCQLAPALENNFSGADNSTMAQYPYYKTEPCSTDKPIYYHRVITERSDLRYNILTSGHWNYADSLTISTEDTQYFAVYYQGAASVNETFNIRVAGHFEIMGATINDPGLDITRSDTRHLENVVTGVQREMFNNPTSRAHTSGMSKQRQEGIISKLIYGLNDAFSPAPGLTKMIIDKGREILRV